MVMTKRSWRLLASAALLVSLLPISGFSADFKIENNTSRWGSDYKRFQIGSAEACAAACAADSQCRAWSYIKPADKSPAALCRLKSAVPQARADECCTSGVAATAVSGLADKSSKVASIASKPAPSGVTGSIKRKEKSKKAKPAGVTQAIRPAGETLQMPIEAETPEALTSISASLDMPEPTLGN